MLAAPDTTGHAAAKSDSDVLGRKRRWFRAYETNKRREMDEARVARRYYHGKQWTDEEVRRLTARGQPVITSNRIKRKVDFLVGVEQRMRRDPKAYPRNPADAPSATAATAAIRFACDINRWEQLASVATHDGLVSGIGVLFIGIEPRGQGLEVKMRAVACDRFFYDPRSEQPDFSDARYLGLHLWMDIDEAKERWPHAAKTLDDLMDINGGLTALKAEEDRNEQWGDFEHRRVRVIEFWEKRREGWYQCMFTGDTELEGAWSPYLDEEGRPACPYLAWTPYVDERGDRYGVVRDMRPIQDEVNHRRSKFLHLLNVRQVHVRPGAVKDVDKFKSELARPDGVVEVNGEWGTDVGIIDQSQEVQGQAELLTEAKAELENLGPNPGLIGKGGGIADQSGRAILAQRDSGMTELSPVYDRLRDWKLRVYRAAWARIRQAWTSERWIRVTESSDGSQFLGLNQYQQDPMTGQIQAQNVLAEIDVDVILDEGPDTIMMQEEEFQQLTQMAQAGVPIPPQALIQMSSLQNKDQLLQAMQPQVDPQQQQLQQAQQDQIMRGNEAKIAEAQSKVELNRATAMAKMIDAQIAATTPPDLGQEMYGGS